jgi:hypothetical protein
MSALTFNDVMVSSFRDELEKIASGMGPEFEKIAGIGDFLGKAVGALKGGANAAGIPMKPLLGGGVAKAVGGLQGAASRAGGAMQSAASRMGGALNKGMESARQGAAGLHAAGGAAVNRAGAAMQSAAQRVGGAASGAAQRVQQGATNLAQDARTAVRDAKGAVRSGVEQGMGRAQDAMGAARSAVTNAAGDAAEGIGRAGRQARDFVQGRNMNVAVGGGQMDHIPMRSLGNMLNPGPEIAAMGQSLGRGVRDLGGMAREAVAPAVGQARQAMGNAVQKMRGIGSGPEGIPMNSWGRSLAMG